MQTPPPRNIWDRVVNIMVIVVVLLFLALVGGYIYWVTHFHFHVVF